MALNYTHIWSPTIISDFTVGVRHSTEREDKDNFQAVAKLGSRQGLGISSLGYLFPPPGDNPFDLVPNITYSSTTFPTTFGFGTRFDQPGSNVQFNITHATTFVLGGHTVKAGFFWDRGRDIEGRAGATNGSFDFGLNPTNPLNSGNAFANQLLGNFYQYSEANTRIPLLMFRYVFDWYLQDTWKVNKRLTLDFGVRFDYSNWPGTEIQTAHGRGEGVAGTLLELRNIRVKNIGRQDARLLAPDRVKPEVHAVVLDYIEHAGAGAESSLAIAEYVPRQTKPGHWQDSGLFGKSLRNTWAALQEHPIRDTSRSGHVGRYEGRREGLSRNRIVCYALPVYDRRLVQSRRIRRVVKGGNEIGRPVIVLVKPVTYSYDFGIQRDLGRSLLLDVKYVGALGRHLTGAVNVNALPLGSPFLHPDSTNPGQYLIPNLIRPYPGYGDINIMTNAASSNYNALQVTLNRRYAHGLEFGVAYTYSKSMDYDSNTRASGATYTPTYLSANRNYGPSDFDQTQVLTANWQYDIPGVNGSNKLVSGVTHNWQISGVATFSEGTPFTINPLLLANTVGGGDYQRVNITCDPNYGHFDRTATNWFNASCAQYPGATLGNEGRNIVRGPGRTNFDLALFRNFNLGSEKRVLTFRWETYNTFNHTQFNTIDTSPRYSPAGAQINPTFGQALSAYPARQMQFSLRVRF